MARLSLPKPVWLIGFNLLLLLVLLTGLEFASFRLYLGASSGARLTAARAFHLTRVRRNLTFDVASAAHDSELSYVLRPGRHHFASQEYAFDYEINAAGLRDDPASIEAPEVIVLGDSYAFGWGVATEEAFPNRLEVALGRPVLNAGVPSYSTSRSLRQLHRLDRSRLKVLVLQYCDNDRDENRRHFKQQGIVPAISRDQWTELCQQFEQPGFDYHPGKYLRQFVPLWLEYGRQGFTNGVPPFVARVRDAKRESGLLTYAFLKQAPELQGVHLVLFELSSYGKNDPALPAEAAAQMAIHNPKEFGFASITGLDLSRQLEGRYFRLDDHITGEGHRVVAEQLAKVVRPKLEPPPDQER